MSLMNIEMIMKKRNLCLEERLRGLTFNRMQSANRAKAETTQRIKECSMPIKSKSASPIIWNSWRKSKERILSLTIPKPYTLTEFLQYRAKELQQIARHKTTFSLPNSTKLRLRSVPLSIRNQRRKLKVYTTILMRNREKKHKLWKGSTALRKFSGTIEENCKNFNRNRIYKERKVW